MHKRTIPAILAGLSIATLALSGCSTSGGTAAPVTELTAWAAQSTSDAVKQVVADYATSSGVKIDLQIIPDGFEANLLTKWTAGQRPDIMFFQPAKGQLSQLNPKKNLQDLGSLDFVNKTKFGLADSGMIDGVHYTATYGFPAVFGVYYNTKVFADNGIKVPTSQAELDKAAQTLKAAGVYPPSASQAETSGAHSWASSAASRTQ